MWLHTLGRYTIAEYLEGLDRAGCLKQVNTGLPFSIRLHKPEGQGRPLGRPGRSWSFNCSRHYQHCNNFLNIRVVRRDRYQARLFVDREYYEKLYKDDFQCILTWLKRLTLRDILFDATATSRRQRGDKWCKQTWRRPVRISLYLAIVLLLLSGIVHPNPAH